MHEKFADVVDRVYDAAALASLYAGWPRNDPTDTGGLFIGRRPGTAPVRYREVEPSSERRKRADGLLAHGLLAIELLLCLSLFGPQPLAWFWIGSQVQYQTGYVTAGIGTILLGCLASLMLTMALAKRVDHAWKLVRRAAGHRQERGALERIFAASVGVALVALRDLVLRDPGAGADPRARRPSVGFRDYYRQFDDIDEAKLNLERRERRRQEKAAALARAPDIDLSGTEWPDLPHSEIVNAAIARARGCVQRYPDRHATSVRRLLADRHGLSPDQIALGNGAAELLQSAALALLSAGDELVMPWPSYPLYPLMAAHAGATPVPGRATAARRRRHRAHARPSSSATRTTRPGPTSRSVRASRPAHRPPRAMSTSCSTRRSSTSRTPRTGCVPAAGRRLPPPAGGADLLEDLRPVRPARGLRGDLGLAPARRGRRPCWASTR